MALLPIICTANVENGSNMITVVGEVLNPGKVTPGASVVLAGLTYSIHADGYQNTTQIKLSRNYAGTTATGVPCEIAQWTQEMLSRVAMSQTLRDYDARSALVDAYGKGLFYQSTGYTAEGDPGAGYVARNNPSWNSTNMLMIDVIDQGGHNEAPRLAMLEVGTVLTLRSIANGAYISFRMTELATPEDTGGWYKFDNLELIGSDATLGAPGDNEDLAIEMLRVGEGLAYSKHSPDVAGLSAYTGTPGLKVLVSDTGDGEPGIYTRNDADNAWIGPALIKGAPGADGATVEEVLLDLGVHNITISTEEPSGGEDNDLWFKVSAT